jgi:hypothetical protein
MSTDINLKQFAENNNLELKDVAAGTVLAGVILILGQDPQIKAMLENNDKEHFIEGCNAWAAFNTKFGEALLQVREMVA